MMTEWLASSAAVGFPLCLSFADRTAKVTPSTTMATRQTIHILFDLEEPFATRPGRASPGCEIRSSVSSRDGIICHLPGRYSDASVRAPRASETGIPAQYGIYRATIF